ncbi:hypothetical protein WMF38_52445 [Sorangium sp. So ce118]
MVDHNHWQLEALTRDVIHYSGVASFMDERFSAHEKVQNSGGGVGMKTELGAIPHRRRSSS